MSLRMTGYIFKYNPLKMIISNNTAAAFPVNFVNKPRINKIPITNSTNPRSNKDVSAGRKVIILSTGGLTFKNNLPMPLFKKTMPKPRRIIKSTQLTIK